MGERKRKKQYNKAELIAQEPFCCYCGEPAEEPDHCPPRALFRERQAPEGYDFPACKRCNQGTRMDEQMALVVLRPTLLGNTDEKWHRTVASLRTNHPKLMAELNLMPQNEARRLLDRNFGAQVGRRMRQQGFVTANLGENWQRALDNLSFKLGQALFYKHIGRRCTGRVWIMRVNHLFPASWSEQVLEKAPFLPTTQRGRKELADQFTYRYNINEEQGILLAMVKCGEQFGAIICALDEPYASQFAPLGDEKFKWRFCPVTRGDESRPGSPKI